MTIEIVDQKEWRVEVECRGCRSILRIESEDVLFGTFGGDWVAPGDPHFYVPCPVCETDAWVDSKLLTPKIEREAKERSSC